MLVHRSYYSLRYGTISIQQLVAKGLELGLKRMVLADINNTSAVFDFVALCREAGIAPVVGVECRNGNELCYLCVAENVEGFRQINDFVTKHNMQGKAFPNRAPHMPQVHVVYPLAILEQGFVPGRNEYVGVRLSEVNKLWRLNVNCGAGNSELGVRNAELGIGNSESPQPTTHNSQPTTDNPQPTTHNSQLTTDNPQPTTHNSQLTTDNPQPTTHNSQPTTDNPQPDTLQSRLILYQPVTFASRQGYNLHRLLRAIDENCLLSKLPKESQCAEDEYFHTDESLRRLLANYPCLLDNTQRLFERCSFDFVYEEPKNKKTFSASPEADRDLLSKLAYDGLAYRYGKGHKEARARVEKELKIIYELGFGSYFLITWDIIRYARSRGYFHVGRGSGANSIVAYCLQITDVDPIQLDLYFERFINPHRTSPPDFDIDFSWDERDEIIDYVFKRYGADYVCLLATYVTFKDRSAYRELAKVFGLPKHEIDAMIGGRTWAFEHVERGGGNVLKAEYGQVNNAELGVRNAELGMRNAELGVRNAELGVRNSELPQLTTHNSQLTNGVRNAELPQLTTHNPELTTHNPELTTHNSQLTTDNPQATTHNAQLTTDNPQRTTHNSQSTTQRGGTTLRPGAEVNQVNSMALIYKYGKLLEDFPNYLSIHAGGILISEKPMSYYTALLPMPKGFPICQFDMYVAEDIGFAKFDVLSQRGLGHIKESVDIIRENCGQSIDVHAIQKFKDDPAIRRQMQRHETMGCFYIESPAMRQLIWKLRCADYLTLVAASSIIRPGVASSGMMGAYIERHHDPSKVAYIHPKMKDLLEETYGVMVYQEDVIKVAHHFAGLTLAESDVLRRAMSGKYRSRAAFQRIVDKFFENCRAFGYPDAIAKEVWRQIESFSGYSFSKAHSASFAVESYQSLYIKTYYPREFMVAVINNFGGFYKTEFYVHEARRTGAYIEAPCINHSRQLTHIQGSTIWLGWVHVKGLEQRLTDWILTELSHSPFHSFDDFCRRVPTGLEQLIILIRVGAFRSFGVPKKELLWQAHMKFNSRSSYVSAMELFALPETHWQFPSLTHHPLEDAYDELELLGFTLLSPFLLLAYKPSTPVHALNMAEFIVNAENGKRKTEFGVRNSDLGMRSAESPELTTHNSQRTTHNAQLTTHNPQLTTQPTPGLVSMVGYMVTLKPTRTKKGERMVFGYFLDEFGEFFDTVHFPTSTARYPFSGWGLYHMQGYIRQEYGHCSLHVQFMEKLPILPDPRSI